MTENLLHEQNLLRMPFIGQQLLSRLAARTEDVARATEGIADPNVSIVIRTRNNEKKLGQLFEDLDTQQFKGEKEVIVVDTDSTDLTRRVARKHGAEFISISRYGFNYPSSLNRGFEAASHDLVFTFIGNAALTNNQSLRVATRWQGFENFAAAYGFTLPNEKASLSERAGAYALKIGKLLDTKAGPVNTGGIGFMAASCSVVAKEAWQEAGGYDERYAAGGDDGALGQTFLESGRAVVLDPALSIYHTNGLGPIKSIMQLRDWQRMAEPHDFDMKRIEKFRPDLF